MTECRSITRSGAALAFLLVSSCSTAPPPFMGSPTRGQMVAHFDLAAEMRDLAIAGDLPAFRSAAQALADLDPARDLPPEVILQLGPMRWEAQDGAGARTTAAAAQATAEVARTCGECHVANDAGVGATLVREPPRAASDAKSHMAGLAAVTDLLWQGLAVPSDASWEEGARALAATGALPDELLERLPTRDVQFASDRLQRLAHEAQAAATLEYRVQALGEIWATCSGCHAARPR